MVVRTGRHWANANLERENFTVFNRQSKSIPTDSPGFKDSWVKPNQWENSPRYLQITPPTVSHWSSKNWPKHIYVWPIVLTLYISQHKSWQVKQDSPYLIISSFFQILPSLFFRCERSLLTRSKQSFHFDTELFLPITILFFTCFLLSLLLAIVAVRVCITYTQTMFLHQYN